MEISFSIITVPFFELYTNKILIFRELIETYLKKTAIKLVIQFPCDYVLARSNLLAFIVLNYFSISFGNLKLIFRAKW